MSEESGGRGGIGVQIFEQVEQMVAAEGITRSEAFQRLSEATGRRAGTVAANYYRIARMRGTVRPRGGASAGTRRGRPRKQTGGDDVSQALADVSAAVERLAVMVRRQEKDLARLREQSEQLAKLRKLLG